MGEVVIANVLPYNRKGDVLLQHRDDIPTIVEPKLWSLFGGTSNSARQLELGLVREIREELSHTLTNFRLLAVARRHERTFYIHTAPLDLPLCDLSLNEGQDFGFFRPNVALQTLPLSAVAHFALQTFEAHNSYLAEAGGQLQK